MTRYQTSKIIKIILILLIVGVVLSYTIFNSRFFIAGPRIEIIKPSNGQVFEESSLTQIVGKARNIIEIKINDRNISVDEEGNFKESLLLSPGYNIIWLTARDRFEREEKVKLEVVYKDQAGSRVQSSDWVASSTATTTEEVDEEILEEDQEENSSEF